MASRAVGTCPGLSVAFFPILTMACVDVGTYVKVDVGVNSVSVRVEEAIINPHEVAVGLQLVVYSFSFPSPTPPAPVEIEVAVPGYAPNARLTLAQFRSRRLNPEGNVITKLMPVALGVPPDVFARLSASVN